MDILYKRYGRVLLNPPQKDTLNVFHNLERRFGSGPFLVVEVIPLRRSCDAKGLRGPLPLTFPRSRSFQKLHTHGADCMVCYGDRLVLHGHPQLLKLKAPDGHILPILSGAYVLPDGIINQAAE